MTASPVAVSASICTLSSFPRCARGSRALHDEHRADVVSKIGQPEAVLESATDPDDLVDERVRPRIAQVIAIYPEQVRIRPDRDVDDHQSAPDQRENVDDRPPAPELEPRPLVRPATAPGDEHAEVAQEVRDVDHAGRRDGDVDRGPGPGHDERDGGEDADRDRGVGRGLEVPLTCPHAPPSGSRRSRPIENISRTVAPWIASVHT